MTSSTARACGILLAGGASRRFPPNKLLETMAGEPLFWRALRALAAATDEVVVMIGAGHAAPDLPRLDAPVRIARDANGGAGPLAALADALSTIHADIAVAIAGDAPETPPDLLRAMRADLASGSADVLALRDGAHVRPLPVVLRTATCARATADLVERGILRLGVIVESAELRVDARDESWWRRHDPGGSWRRDIDTPADLRPRPWHERTGDGSHDG